jgi:predicted secreted protein
MNWFTGTMVFVVVWWTVIFAVLPWGNRPPEKVEPGHATSAPAKPRLTLKFAVTTVLAALIWVAIDQAVRRGLVSFRE